MSFKLQKLRPAMRYRPMDSERGEIAIKIHQKMIGRRKWRPTLAVMAVAACIAPLTWVAASSDFSDLDEARPESVPDIKAVGEAAVMQEGSCSEAGPEPFCPANSVRRDELATSLRRLGGMGNLRFACATAASSRSTYPGLYEHCRRPSINTFDPGTPQPPGAAARSISLAIGTDGRPIIGYIADGAVKIAHCGNQFCSGGNTVTTIDGSGLGPENIWLSLAIGDDGNPVMTYNFAMPQIPNPGKQGSTLKLVHCLNPSCTTFDPPTILENPRPPEVGGAPIVGVGNSIAIGANGFPIISYVAPEGGVKVVTCRDHACSEIAPNARTSALIDDNRAGAPTSIATAPDENPVITYHSGTSPRGARLVVCPNQNCGGPPAPEVIMLPSQAGIELLRSSVVIGADGFPLIVSTGSFVSGSSAGVSRVEVTRCAGDGYKECTSQAIASTTTDPDDTILIDSSVDIGLDGLPLIAFSVGNSNGTNRELKVIRCSTLTCSKTDVSRVDPGGQPNSLAVGIDGMPLIAYSGFHVTSANSPPVGIGMKLARPPLIASG